MPYVRHPDGLQSQLCPLPLEVRQIEREHPPQESANANASLLAALRTEAPGLFIDGELQIEALAARLGIPDTRETDRYRFEWAGKREALDLARAQTRATLHPKPQRSYNFDTARHAIIVGDNLEVLKILLRSYFGRVKLIYLDPPYNTGNDFIYADDFTDPLAAYLRLTNQASHDGQLLHDNPETSGRFHSRWLSMMLPRLILARQLLTDDGIIVISIDDREFAHLRLILNETFGEQNFLGTVVWNSTKTVTNTALLSVSHTYNLVYARDIGYFREHRSALRLPESGDGFTNGDNDPRGPWKADPFQVGGVRPNQQYTITNPKTGHKYRPNAGSSWKNELAVFNRLLADNRIVFGATGEAGPQRKRFLSEARERGRVATTLWSDIDTTANATRALNELLGGQTFTNPKPVSLIRRFLQLAAPDRDSLVLDFFAGSGTTAQAVVEQNAEDGGSRRYILVNLPEPTGNAQFPTIPDIAIERLKRINQMLKASGKDEQGFRTLELATSVRRTQPLESTADEPSLLRDLEQFSDTIPRDVQPLDVIQELALSEALGCVPTFAPADDFRANSVTQIGGDHGSRRLYLCLDAVLHEDTARQLTELLTRNDLFVCRDSAITDSVFSNLVLGARVQTI